MAGTPDDDTARFELDPTGDEQSPPSTGTADEPLVSGGPLGLGESPPPDSPSRHPRPKILSLLGEFFRMSRATAILLTVFVVVGVLYLIVREDPVVGFGPAPTPTTSGSTETSSATPTEATPTEATPTAATSAATPTAATPTGGMSAPTATPQSQQSATGVPAPGGDGQQQAPQEQAPQQQQQVPEGGAASPGAQ